MKELGSAYLNRGPFLLKLAVHELAPLLLAIPFAVVFFFQVVPFAEEQWYHYTLVVLALVAITRLPNHIVMTRVLLPPAFEWIRIRKERRTPSAKELATIYTRMTWMVPRMQLWAGTLWLLSDVVMIAYARLFLIKTWTGLLALAFTMITANVISLSFSYFTFQALVRPLLEDVNRHLHHPPREGAFRVSLRLKIGGSIFGLILLAFLTFGLFMAVKVRTLFEGYALAVNDSSALRLAGELSGPDDPRDVAGLISSYSDETRIFLVADADGGPVSEANRRYWSRDVQEAVRTAARSPQAVVKVTTESAPFWIYSVPDRPRFLVVMAHPARVQEGVLSLLGRTAVFLVAILFLMGTYIYWLTRDVMRMVDAGARYNRRLSEGDLTEVPPEWSDDELGDMADHLRVTFRGLTRLAKEIRNASEVVETEAVRLSTTSQELLPTVSDQASLAEEPTRASQETQHSMSLVSQAMSQVASATQDVSATILQMRANVADIT